MEKIDKEVVKATKVIQKKLRKENKTFEESLLLSVITKVFNYSPVDFAVAMGLANKKVANKLWNELHEESSKSKWDLE